MIATNGNGAGPIIPRRRWPLPPGDEARIGLAGEFVRLVEPHSEADPAALLVQFLAAFGNVIGRSAGFMAEGDFHGTNVNVAIVGRTSKARKGTSWGRVREAMAFVDGDWTRTCVTSGLSSGEGVVWRVRDEVVTRRRAKKGETGDSDGYISEVTDPGISDKRLLVIEGELAQALRVMRREGNTLSVTVRNLWDSGTQGSLTKNTPARTTGAHVSVIGHIVAGELKRELTATDAANGFANRFLFVCAKRSKLLPDGGCVPVGELEKLARRVKIMADHAQTVGVLERNGEARTLWHAEYERLSEGGLGLVGAITGRAEAQVMRLAVIYALLDTKARKGPIIHVEHLRAALAVWDYCSRSVAYIFGEAVGDPVADAILAALQATPDGMKRSEIRADLLGRHTKAERLDIALSSLAAAGLAASHSVATSGRPAEIWCAVSAREGSE